MYFSDATAISVFGDVAFISSVENADPSLTADICCVVIDIVSKPVWISMNNKFKKSRKNYLMHIRKYIR